MSGPPYSGGCQCGAVRFRVDAAPRHTSLCHCRMCQKATGSPFGAFASFPAGAVSWTRGARKTFQSSDAIARGFCGDCGTPMTFEAASGAGDHIALTIASFDDPSAFVPQRQIMRAERIGWIDALAGAPARSEDEDATALARYPAVVSRQHPDHDTETWPPSPDESGR
ncbi:MAG TPA: GFA family protein [Caulobacteraceae bacterium]|nr:GFA family protein [Caulobacteraceae bacterium]